MPFISDCDSDLNKFYTPAILEFFHPFQFLSSLNSRIFLGFSSCLEDYPVLTG